MTMLQNANAIESGGYNVTNSIRFRSSNSAYLSRTPTSNGNRQTWTWSAWVKRGQLGAYQVLFGAGLNNNVNADELVSIYFTNSDQLGHYVNETGVADRNNISTAVFRDPSAWYHIVAVYDSTNATAANRQRLYVNGVQITSWSATSIVSQNYQPSVNSTAYPHAIGKYGFNSTRYLDGYMAEVNFIDGQALTPSSFGETDTTTGVWKPKAYTGTYGTNGFYLKFSDIATTSGSNAGLGKDFSGNSNYWTTNNISVTSGTTYDAMTDSPTNTSATVANYAVLNAVNTSSNTITDGNLKTSFSAVGGNRSTIGMSSGKWYWEVSPTTCPSFTLIGIVSASVAITGDISASNAISYMSQTGYWWRNNVGTAYGATYTTTDVIGIAVDIDNNTITFYKNGVSQGAITSVTLNTDTWFACMGNAAASATVGIYNFGQRPFAYTPPTGYVALNTYNLPTPTILQGNKYMDATLYTGTGTTQVAVNQGQFKPDLVWLKIRSGAGQHVLTDSVRGVSKQVFSSLTNAETTEAGKGVTSFNSNGFTLGDELVVTGSSNVNSATYVGWQWQAGQGTTSSNTSGSITSTVSVNTTAGFSVVTFTQPASGSFTVGHGLGVAPKMIIGKDRTSASTNWVVYHSALSSPQSNYLTLNTTNAVTSSTNIWNNTAPTSTVISSISGYIANSNSNTVLYCWAEISGYSKAFSYTGNGSTDGPMVYLGFKPKFIMIKRTDSTSSWFIHDTARDTYNVSNKNLYPNLSAAEEVQTTWNQDILSNGFKTRGTSAELNANGGTYIGMAFSSNPFKNSTAV